MAWNEPGKDKQPDDAPRDDRSPRGEQGPPNLDEAFGQLSKKISNLFGKSKSGRQRPSNNGNGSSLFRLSGFGIIAVFIIILIVWVVSGIFIVSAPEKAVILRFGKYEKTVGPGPHWIPRFIDSETKINVEKIISYHYSAQMLTKDQNIVDVAVVVQYRILNPENFLYNVTNPVLSLEQATASALRQVIGNTTLDSVLTSGRAVVRDKVQQQLEKILSLYRTGILVTDVALQPAKAPEQVKAAFDDAIKAQEDEQTYINQAQAYAMGVVPIAEGNAKRIAEEASAYKKQVVLQAQAHTARYLAVLPIYKSAPTVTRDRLYISTMQDVLEHTPKIFIDSKESHNLLYLPLTQLVQHAMQQSTSDNGDATSKSLAATGKLSIKTPTSKHTPSQTITRPQRFSMPNPDSQVRGGGR